MSATLDSLHAELDAALSACDTEEWDEADAALTRFDQALRAAVAAGDADLRAGLPALAERYQQLSEELERRRIEAAEVLQAMNRGGQAARAYRQGE